MNSIQKKILMLITVVLIFMSIIWIALTYYNYKTQEQYNGILQRYLSLNEVTTTSQQMIIDLNNFMIQPSEENGNQLSRSTSQIQQAKNDVSLLRNEENNFTLTNYINLIDSFVDTTNRLLLFHSENNSDGMANELSEATRISTYISEMSLSLLDTEINTYDRFYRSVIEQSGEVVKLGILVLLLMMCVLFIITYWFSLSITRPILELTQAANALSNGKFDKPVKVETNDEIAFLARTFNRMRININSLIVEIKHKAQLEHELQESKLLLQESQFRSLQSQISPHFLFNTLNTLSKKAYLEGSEETSDLLVSVAGILRYNLKQLDRSVTLQEEMMVVKQYMDIQKARFTERLQFYLKIDEQCLDLPIPSLTLQPIIENAIIHGIEPKEQGGTIWFRVKDEKHQVVIEVEDDGVGMTEEKIQQIIKENPNSYEVPTKGIGIGFSNVVKRLRLFYSNDDVLAIKSMPGEGTKIILKIRRNEIR